MRRRLSGNKLLVGLIGFILLCWTPCGTVRGQEQRENASADQRVTDASGSTTLPAGSKPDLSGLWLADQAPIFPVSKIMQTTLRLTDHTFTLHGYWNFDKNWTGTFTRGDGGTFDLQSDGYDFKEIGWSSTHPPCRLPGIFKLDGGRLTISFAKTTDDPRPMNFAPNEHALTTSLIRPEAGWSGFPKTVTVTVLDPQGQPDPNAEVFGYMNRSKPLNRRADGKFYSDATQPASLRLDGSEKTGADGTVVLPYDRFTDNEPPIGARDASRGWIGIVPISPGLVHNGTLTIRLQPERTIRGVINCEHQAAPGSKLPWRAAYLTACHDRVAFCEALDGSFEFVVPPGTYSLYTYGNELRDVTREITVPAGAGDFVVPPVELQSSPLLALIGKPAPPLVGVKVWKNGPPVQPSDYKGKVVLLDFWGYWCGNCVVAMPTLMHLQDKYKDKGLVVIAVHVDEDGEVDTIEKLDARTKMYRDGIWKGHDLPFPVALCSGKDSHAGGNPDRYGIQYYPTTIVIDRAGNVVGVIGDQLPFDLYEQAAADAGIEKLLATK